MTVRKLKGCDCATPTLRWACLRLDLLAQMFFTIPEGGGTWYWAKAEVEVIRFTTKGPFGTRYIS